MHFVILSENGPFSRRTDEKASVACSVVVPVSDSVNIVVLMSEIEVDHFEFMPYKYMRL